MPAPPFGDSSDTYRDADPPFVDSSNRLQPPVSSGSDVRPVGFCTVRGGTVQVAVLLTPRGYPRRVDAAAQTTRTDQQTHTVVAQDNDSGSRPPAGGPRRETQGLPAGYAPNSPYIRVLGGRRNAYQPPALEPAQLRADRSARLCEKCSG